MHYILSTFSTLFSAGRSNQDSGSSCEVLLRLRRPLHGLWGYSRNWSGTTQSTEFILVPSIFVRTALSWTSLSSWRFQKAQETWPGRARQQKGS